MADQAILREVTLTLPMLPDMEIAAGRTATELAAFMRMTPDKIDEVRMAVVEAFINAFEHSHAGDQKVYIRYRVIGRDEPERLKIEITDNGVGFLPNEVEEPVIAEKLKASRKRGWGLKIIKGLMDEVRIESSGKGTTLSMSKSV